MKLKVRVWCVVSAYIQPMFIVGHAKQWFNPCKTNFSMAALGEVFSERLITPWTVVSEISRSECVWLLFEECFGLYTGVKLSQLPITLFRQYYGQCRDL